MSADWKAGDLAVCIVDRWCHCGKVDCGINALAPKKEELLRVDQVCIRGDHCFLHFKAKGEQYAWSHVAFRKVKPDTEPAADEAWVEQLKHLRRKVPT